MEWSGVWAWSRRGEKALKLARFWQIKREKLRRSDYSFLEPQKGVHAWQQLVYYRALPAVQFDPVRSGPVRQQIFWLQWALRSIPESRLAECTGIQLTSVYLLAWAQVGSARPIDPSIAQWWVQSIAINFRLVGICSLLPNIRLPDSG